MGFDTVIRNGLVITSKREINVDIGITGGKIAALGKGFEGKREIDASGKLVTPGAVDIHVHLQMNIGGKFSSDDFFDGTRAAAFGGTTAIVDFVEPSAEETLTAALKNRRAAADPRVVIDYGLHMTIGPNEIKKLDQIPELAKQGIRSYKMYMAYGLRLNDGEMLAALEAVRDAGGMPVIHAENWDVIQTLIKRNIDEGNTAPVFHPESRPALLEGEAVSRVMSLAEYAGVPVHIFHISCASAVEALKKAAGRGLPVTGETCPQYLFLTKMVHKRAGVEGALPVCSPPLRGSADQEYLWNALKKGDIQVISTDHCPFTREEKAAGMDRFDRIPGGVPSIEMRLSAIYSGGVKTGLISSPEWVDLCCTRPAGLIGMKNKGDIVPGFDADLVIFDPEKKWRITPETLHETAGWTPYEGLEITGKPEKVFSRGEMIVDNEKFLGEKGRGRFING